MHNIKQKRLQRSQEKNPLFEEKKIKRKQKKKEKKLSKMGAEPTPAVETLDEKPSAKCLKRRAQKLKKKQQQMEEIKSDATAQFSGVLAEPGTGTMRTKWKLKEQSQLHQTDVQTKKKELRKVKEKKQLLLEKKEVDRTKQKRKLGSEVDNFSFMVEKYKKIIDSNNEGPAKRVKKSKWYTE